MSTSLLKAVRLTHLYFGVLISPALLFFAFTGALQTFSLHETTRGSSYQPPRWAVVLGQIHKKQTPIVTARKPQPPEVAAADKHGDRPEKKADAPPAPPSATPAKPHNAMPLKIFFLLVSIGLFTSTLTGIYMSYKYNRNKAVVTGLLVIGTVLPILLAVL
jgi:hypothetical protein